MFSIVTEVGDNILPYVDDRCVVVCNHQSTGDVPVLSYCLADKPRVCNYMMWIIDSLFKYTNFGIISQVHKDFFIKQVSVFSHFVDPSFLDWLQGLLFS